MTDKENPHGQNETQSDFKEIGRQLKELGDRLIKASDKFAKSKEAQEISDAIADTAKEVKEGITSGKFASDAKRDIKDALSFVNQKMDEYLKDDKDPS
jgi:gas vesicle protein